MDMVGRRYCTRFPFLLLAAVAALTFVAARLDAAVTGADACGDASIVPISVGPVGSPSVTVFSGDLTTATGPDCNYSQDVGVALWWEAFELTECADVTIELCGTTPLNYPSRPYLYTNCPASGTSCGTPVFAAQQSRLRCIDNNVWLSFPELPPGIYYFPILADPNVLQTPPGTYQITMTAQQCAGACCDLTAGICADLVLPADCSSPDLVYHAQRDCCSVDCIAQGETHAAFGVELLSHIPLSGFPGFPNAGNDIWGYASPSGREYALIGLSNSTAVVEVTDPFNPVVIDRVSGASCTWRDIKTLGTYAYIVNDCSGGMDIVDLANVDDGVVRFVKRFTGSGFNDAHNIYINEATGFAYVVSSNLGGGGLAALSLANPEDPVFVGAWPFTGVHDVYVSSYKTGPYAGREIAFDFNPGYGLSIVDVTVKSNMFELSRLTYPHLGTTHQGWLTDDKSHVLFGDESDETSAGLTSTVYVADVQDLANPQLVTTFTNGICSIDHNLIIKGGLTYQANYSSGLRVYDTSDVNNIQEVAYFDTYPFGNVVSFVGAWGVYPLLPSGIVLISDIEDGLFVLNYDCNGNEIDDTVDISNLTSNDCNANGLPDECEFDCDENAVPDECDIAGNAALDADGNGILDVCECTAVPAPTLVVDDHAKSRYLSIVPGNAGVETALRVTLGSLEGFPAHNGRVLWVGPPRPYPEEDISDPQRTFTGASLTCEPHFRDWGTIGTLHIFGGEIIPGSSYQIHAVHTRCAAVLDQVTSFGDPIEPPTGLFGDVVPPFADDPGAPAQPDFNDIAGIVQKFVAAPTAPIKAFAQLQPNVALADRLIDFKDIAADVSAFVGTAYPDMPGITGPCACPSSVTCGATACANDAACGGGYCIDGFCTDACGRCTP